MKEPLLSTEQLVELLASERERGSYEDALREFGVEITPRIPPTRKQLFMRRWHYRIERVRDAWAVLTGKAYVE